MKVTMSQQELHEYISTYDQDRERDDALIRPDLKAPSGWCVYVALNHWDIRIPIEVEG